MVFRTTILIGFLLFAVQRVDAQNDYLRDTSYSITSAYIKIKKNYTEVSPFKPQSRKGVKEDRNVVYADVGRDITLDIFYPKKRSKKGFPGVLLIYGGGWSSGEKAN